MGNPNQQTPGNKQHPVLCLKKEEFAAVGPTGKQAQAPEKAGPGTGASCELGTLLRNIPCTELL